MQYTLDLFQQLIDNIPPLFSDDLRYQMRRDLKNIQENNENLQAVEDLMIQYGYEIWPWRQAFEEFITLIEEKMGEQFLLANLSPALQEKILEYRALGLSVRDFYLGKIAHYFSDDDRAQLSAALIEMRNNIREFAKREVVGLQKEKYLKKVAEFKIILDKIKNDLDRLRLLAESENDHPRLADEIEARVEAFEHGLCLLAPTFEHNEVEQAHEFFVGRKQELNRLRGIHKTIEVDFYSADV